MRVLEIAGFISLFNILARRRKPFRPASEIDFMEQPARHWLNAVSNAQSNDSRRTRRSRRTSNLTRKQTLTEEDVSVVLNSTEVCE